MKKWDKRGIFWWKGYEGVFKRDRSWPFFEGRWFLRRMKILLWTPKWVLRTNMHKNRNHLNRGWKDNMSKLRKMNCSCDSTATKIQVAKSVLVLVSVLLALLLTGLCFCCCHVVRNGNERERSTQTKAETSCLHACRIATLTRAVALVTSLNYVWHDQRSISAWGMMSPLVRMASWNFQNFLLKKTPQTGAEAVSFEDPLVYILHCDLKMKVLLNILLATCPESSFHTCICLWQNLLILITNIWAHNKVSKSGIFPYFWRRKTIIYPQSSVHIK